MFCLRFLTPQIHNFSNYTLSNSEHYLLSLGLNFRPTSRIVSVNVLNHQLDDFARSVWIKYFFRDYSSVNRSQYRKLFVKSEWIPPRCPSWIECPLSAIRSELCSLHNHHNHHTPNLSHSEFMTLSRLSSLAGIRILSADKNLGPTIVTDSWYHQEVSHLLSDEKFYKKVDAVPFISMKSKLISILERYGNSIGDKLKSYILQYADLQYLLTLNFYLKCTKVLWLVDL